MAKCPGQDRYYWTPEDVFDVACPACGEPIEFFKTDPLRHCPACGYASPNPRLDAGCAQWCPHAELCVGVKLAAGAEDEANTVRLVDRLLAAARDHLGRSREQIVRSLQALQHAQALLTDAPSADPRVTLAAAVLSGSDHSGADAAAAVLGEAGFDAATIEQVIALLRPDGARGETPEALILAQVRERMGDAEAVSVAGSG